MEIRTQVRYFLLQLIAELKFETGIILLLGSIVKPDSLKTSGPLKPEYYDDVYFDSDEEGGSHFVSDSF